MTERSAKIMIVDDEAVIALRMRKALTAMGYDVVGTASSGVQAVELARCFRPDVILMDIVMPGQLDGIAAADLIKAELDIPIIFLTAYSADQIVEKAKLAEPFGFIVKPFHDSELKAAIEVAVYKKGMERRLRQSKEALETTNQELEQFAYVVSHDLKAPLRAIRQYADFLAEDLGDTLAKEQQEYLRGIRRAIQESQHLIDDLIQLHRVGGGNYLAEDHNLCQFINDLIISLNFPKDVVIKIDGEWPCIKTVPMLLRQIFQNLIQNGVKFNQSSPKIIQIECRAQGEDLIEISVKDNGIGIEPKYHQQIFKVFQRLHTASEYPGTGIGLAIVEKAVTKLGGKLRIDSRPGEGTIFFITLPR
ncbi:MAG: response regulator [Deltaproteobacteria bacterium]|nr:response regulator [Deltaproteobacteria bacterium]